MKLLLDNCLPPALADELRSMGIAAEHLVERELAHAPDSYILEVAARTGQVIVSYDTDFASLLSLSRAEHPSVVLLRGLVTKRPSELALLLSERLSTLEVLLNEGAVVVLEAEKTRVRRLPIHRGSA